MGVELHEIDKDALARRDALRIFRLVLIIQLALMALDIGPGDEVITTPFTFVATAETIAILGAKPVYVDIDEKTFNINPDLIEQVITPKTKAIIPVHLYGQTVDMDPIVEIAREHRFAVIEDAAQAVGEQYKGEKACSLGLMGCISFFPIPRR